jgi:hypothetical protein
LINFPPNPAIDEVFDVPGGGSYIWDGIVWKAMGFGSGGGGGGTPGGPTTADQVTLSPLVFASDNVQDGMHVAETDIASLTASKVAKTGDTMNGPLSVQTGGAGSSRLEGGGSGGRSGFISFHNTDGSRQGYVGWGASNRINIFAEGSWNYQFNRQVFNASGSPWADEGYVMDRIAEIRSELMDRITQLENMG